MSFVDLEMRDLDDVEAGGARGVKVVTLVGADDEGRPLVRLEDGALPRTARVAWTAQPLDWRACGGLRVIVALEDGDAERPIALGVLDAPPPEALPGVPEALRVESGRELVLECGKAKIALRADGRIEIRGGHVVSRSTGPNKIKGSSVHIN